MYIDAMKSKNSEPLNKRLYKKGKNEISLHEGVNHIHVKKMRCRVIDVVETLLVPNEETRTPGENKSASFAHFCDGLLNIGK